MAPEYISANWSWEHLGNPERNRNPRRVKRAIDYAVVMLIFNILAIAAQTHRRVTHAAVLHALRDPD
eukprot:11167002-Lingulodinium_polyedra.AAC.1